MMTPRRSGVMLIVVAAAAAVVLITLFPQGGVVSIGAAVGLAAALAAGGLGAVWTTRTTWGGENAPSAGLSDPARSRMAARRTAVVQAYLLTFGGLAGLIALVLLIVLHPGEILRLSVLAVVLMISAIVGVASLRAVRASHRSAEEEEHASPLPPTDEMPAGWITVTGRDAGLITLYSSAGVVASGFLVWQLLGLALRNDVPSVAWALVGGIIGVAVLSWGWLRRHFPDVSIDVSTRRVRAGSRVASWSDVTAARLSVARLLPGSPRTLFLTLEGADKLTIPLVLRRGGRLGMTDDQRRAALALVEGARIDLPRAREDPGGRFSRALYPAHIDAAQAREVLERPPRSEDDLPAQLV